MKPLKAFILVGIMAVALGSLYRTFLIHDIREKLDRDFVMMSVTAKSNATRFGKPPEGWTVVADGHGHFCPAHHGSPFDSVGEMIRTNEWEAVIACWRIKEVVESQPHYHWTN
jgi:hypothetical protein